MWKLSRDTFGSPDNLRLPWAFLIFGLVVLFVLGALFPKVVGPALELALFISPLWLPILLVGVAWHEWMIFRQSAFIAAEKYTVLEIKPPRSHSKTPLAMEAVLSGIHLSPGEGTWYARAIEGKVRPWWSLEIASIEGQLHFFIWTREKFRRSVESHIYAQYPGVQITEAPDYTRLISANPDEWNIWGCDYSHTKPDPYPIKTYIDYGLDKPMKEYEQTDPLTNMLEFMGSIGKGEQMWVQIIIRVHKGEKYQKKNTEGKTYTWKDEAKKLVQNIRVETVGKIKYKDLSTGEIREADGFPNPTKGESDTMAAIERNVSKLGFDVGIRSVYLARPNHFNVSLISGVVGLFKQLSSEGFNGFKPAHWMTAYNDYPWELFIKKRKNIMARRLVDAYKRRAYFFAPYKTSYMVMSTEELATMYHIPSAAVTTPTLQRVQSATSIAPTNIPI